MNTKSVSAFRSLFALAWLSGDVHGSVHRPMRRQLASCWLSASVRLSASLSASVRPCLEAVYERNTIFSSSAATAVATASSAPPHPAAAAAVSTERPIEYFHRCPVSSPSLSSPCAGFLRVTRHEAKRRRRRQRRCGRRR